MISEPLVFVESTRHVPRLLRHQIMCDLTVKYLSRINNSNEEEEHHESVSTAEPSIKRFYGALLFVDISGFTALSLKLDVESLKNHINDYFSKMLDVIDRWGGDVVKFAGDALYIIWPATVPVTNPDADPGIRCKTAKNLASDPRFVMIAKAAVEKAVACALEINACCCNHKIILGDNVPEAKTRWTKLFNSIPIIMGSSVSASQQSVSSTSAGEEQAAYLNVHSGVGFGLMAGVDIGACDRWEYFLLGDPIAQVAAAESRAEMGDVVISEIAHNLIHPPEYNVTEHEHGHETNATHDENSLNIAPSCGCCQVNGAFYRVSKVSTTTRTKGRRNSIRKSKSKVRLEESVLSSELASSDGKLVEEYTEEIDKVFGVSTSILKQKVYDFLEENNITYEDILQREDISQQQSHQLLEGENEDDGADFPMNDMMSNTSGKSLDTSLSIAKHNARQLSSQSLFSHPDKEEDKNRKLEIYIVQFIRHQLRYVFANWLHRCIVDDLIRHVHEAARKRFDFFALNRSNVLDDYLRSYFIDQIGMSGKSLGLSVLGRSNSNFPMFASPSNKPYSEDLNFQMNLEMLSNSSSNGLGNKFLSGANQSSKMNMFKRQQSFVNDVGLSSELRTVTVMFVKIDGLSAELFVDDHDDDLRMADDDNISISDSINPSLRNSLSGSHSQFFGTNHPHFSMQSDDIPHESVMHGHMNGLYPIMSERDMLATSGMMPSIEPDPLEPSFHRIYNRFHFLQLSSVEKKADKDLLHSLQNCMEVLCQAFADNGGQLRQFIMDDKGTVCIGTFGLRGAVAVDNAASALEAAKSIIIKLQDIGLTASIGITSGKAYCGLVGSPLRHEYAVMGPSTNLSARLMCKASPCTVICDADTKTRDRTHRFDFLQEVTAKGYSQPVSTFKPIFEDLLVSQERSQITDTALNALAPVPVTNAAGRRGSLQFGITRQSLDATALEYMLRKSIQFEANTSQKVIPNASLLEIGGSFVVANKSMRYPAESLSERLAFSPVSTLLQDVLQAGFYVQRKRASREYVPVTSNLMDAHISNSNTNANSTPRHVGGTRQSMYRNSIDMNIVNNLTKIYGRDEEIKTIVEFLFFPVCEMATTTSATTTTANIRDSKGNIAASIPMPSSNGFSLRMSFSALRQSMQFGRGSSSAPVSSMPNSNVNNSESPSIRHQGSGVMSLRFITNILNRMILVSAHEGMGKSTLINAIAKKFVFLTKKYTTYNVHIYKNHTSSVHANTPFISIRSIIQDILIRFANVAEKRAQAAAQGTEGKFSTRQSMDISGRYLSEVSMYSRQKTDEQIRQGILFIKPHLSPESQSLLPLFVSSAICTPSPKIPNNNLAAAAAASLNGIIEEDNEFTKSLQGQSRLLQTLELLVEVTQLYSTVTNHLCFLVLEKLHLFDVWSLTWLYRVWKNGQGCVIAGTYNSSQVAPTATTNAAANNNQNVNSANMWLMSNNHLLSGAVSGNMTPSVSFGGGMNHPTSSSSHSMHGNAHHMSMDGNGMFRDTAPARPMENFLKKFATSSRFKLLHLQGLGKDAIMNIARDIATNTVNSSVLVADGGSISSTNESFVAIRSTMSTSMKGSEGNFIQRVVDETFLEKVYDISGGNPLYAYAIANSVNMLPHKAVSVSTSVPPNDNNLAATNSTANSKNQTANSTTTAAAPMLTYESLFAISSNRIEEVICYRFDQLDTFTQVLLKSAAVICSNGATFTIDILVYLLQEEVQHLPNKHRNQHSGQASGASSTRASMNPLLEGSTPPSVLHGSRSRSIDQYEEVFEQIKTGGSFNAGESAENEQLNRQRLEKQILEFVTNLLEREEFIQISSIETSVPETSNLIDPIVATTGVESGDDGGGSSGEAKRFADMESNMMGIPSMGFSESMGAFEMPGELSDEAIRSSHFSFRVLLEQLTIYNLLIETQKEHIHEKVGCYYHAHMPTQLKRSMRAAEVNAKAVNMDLPEGEEVDSTEIDSNKATMPIEPTNDYELINYLLEEMYHWQHARVWTFAITTCYLTIEKYALLDDMEGFKTQLYAAYNLYCSMRHDVGLNSMNTVEYSADELKELLQFYEHKILPTKGLADISVGGIPIPSSMSTSNVLPGLGKANTVLPPLRSGGNVTTGASNNVPFASPMKSSTPASTSTPNANETSNLHFAAVQSPASNSTQYMTEELLHEMCFGDIDTLVTIIKLLMTMVQYHLMTFTSPLFISNILEDCMQILMVCTTLSPTSHLSRHSNGIHNVMSLQSVSGIIPTNALPKGPFGGTGYANQLKPLGSITLTATATLDEMDYPPSMPSHLYKGGALTPPMSPGATTPRDDLPTSAKISGNTATLLSKPTVATANNKGPLTTSQVHHKHIEELTSNVTTSFSPAQTGGAASATSNRPFYLPDLPLYLFPLFHSYIQLYSWSPITSQERMKKAWFICEEYLTFTTALSMQQTNTTTTASIIGRTGSQTIKTNSNKRPVVNMNNSNVIYSVPSSLFVPTTGLPMSNPLNPTQQSGFSIHSPPPTVIGKEHAICCLCAYALLLLKEGKLDKAMQKCNKVILIYHYTKYSLLLIHYYGYDMVPYTLAMVAQSLILTGEIEKGLYYLTVAIDIMKKWSSLPMESSTSLENMYATGGMTFSKSFNGKPSSTNTILPTSVNLNPDVYGNVPCGLPTVTTLFHTSHGGGHHYSRYLAYIPICSLFILLRRYYDAIELLNYIEEQEEYCLYYYDNGKAANKNGSLSKHNSAAALLSRQNSRIKSNKDLSSFGGGLSRSASKNSGFHGYTKLPTITSCGDLLSGKESIPPLNARSSSTNLTNSNSDTNSSNQRNCQSGVSCISYIHIALFSKSFRQDVRHVLMMGMILWNEISNNTLIREQQHMRDHQASAALASHHLHFAPTTITITSQTGTAAHNSRQNTARDCHPHNQESQLEGENAGEDKNALVSTSVDTLFTAEDTPHIRSSYFNYFLYVSGLAMETLTTELAILQAVPLLAQTSLSNHSAAPNPTISATSSPPRSLGSIGKSKSTLSSNPVVGEQLQKFATLYITILDKKPKHQSAFILSELLPLTSLLSVFRDIPSAPHLSGTLIREIQHLIARNERFHYHLSAAILGELLSVLKVPELIEQDGKLLKQTSFQAIQTIDDIAQMKAFEFLFQKVTHMIMSNATSQMNMANTVSSASNYTASSNSSGHYSSNGGSGHHSSSGHHHHHHHHTPTKMK